MRRLGKSIRPCVVVRSIKLRIQGQPKYVYSIVPLTSIELPFGEMAPRLPAREGGLPIRSTALCVFSKTIAGDHIVGYVGTLMEDEYELVAEGLAAVFGLRI